MNKILSLWVYLIVFNINALKAQHPTVVNLQFFYDQLSPYGSWISHSAYGYVWQPNVKAGFRPYLDGGFWVWSDKYQWVWISEYAWGWAAFHYGRWFYDAIYGWLWVPGNQWGPAWVSWRSGSDYYGWAPLSPDVNFGINFSYQDFNPPFDYWIFVDMAFLTSTNLYYHCHPVSHNHDIIVHTQPRPTIHLVDLILNGPSKNDVENQTKEKIPSFNVVENNRPDVYRLEKNNIKIFKPDVDWKDRGGADPQKEIQSNPGLIKKPSENKIQREPKIIKTEQIKNKAPKREVLPKPMPEKNVPVKRIPQNNVPIKPAPEKREPIQKP